MSLGLIEEKDLYSCAELYAEVFSSSPWNEPWTAESALHRLDHFYHSIGFTGFLAKADGVVGFVLGNAEPFHSGSLFYLREMCVAVRCQSQGLGRQLFQALERQLVAKKVERIYLTTSHGIPASGFYQSIGFKCVEEMGFYAKRVSS